MKRTSEKQDTKRQVYELDKVNYPCDSKNCVSGKISHCLRVVKCKHCVRRKRLNFSLINILRERMVQSSVAIQLQFGLQKQAVTPLQIQTET